MKNKFLFLLNLRKNYVLECVGAFAGGFVLSAAVVLYTNEIFYRRVFKMDRGINGVFGELTPKEIFGQGAKKTFIKHQLEPKTNEEIYKEYIDQKNREENLVELKPLAEENHVKILMDKQKERDLLEEYRKNIFEKNQK